MQNAHSLRVISRFTVAILLSIVTADVVAQESKEATQVSGTANVEETAAAKESLDVTGAGKVLSNRENGDVTAEDGDSAGSDEVLEGHSFHGAEFDEGPRQSGRLMGGTGNVHFPATTHRPLVQQFINQGVGQLHGFWNFEAERSFRQAAALDPDCAIAYWGMAMANVNNSKRAKGFVEKALERISNASPGEGMWIKALHDLYHKKYEGEKARSQAYVTALEEIVHKYPEDLEAKTFLALQLFWGKTGKALGVPSREAVDALLAQVFAVNPMHPAHHYRIHLWDYQKPERALHAAAHVGQAAPDIAHMWHMGGHILSRLKRYEDASWQQEASSRVDHAYMVEDGVLPTEINNYTHNQEWFIRNLTKVGRIRDALGLARNLVELPRHPRHNSPTSNSSAVVRGRTRLLDVLITFELWEELIALADTPYLAVDGAEDARIRKLRYLGVAHGALGHQEQSGAQLAALEKLLAEKSAKGATDNPAPLDGETDESKADKKKHEKLVKSIERAVAHIRGQQALSQGRGKEALVLFKEAGDVAKTALATVHLKAGEPEEAEKLAKQAVAAAENECYPLACYVQTLYECGKLEECRRAFEQLRECSTAIDIDMSIFAELQPRAVEFGYPKQWLRAPIQRDDVGERPSLESLGPLVWHTSAAPQWSLPQAEGETRSLGDFRGKPVLVIFYLGFGCLHCVEQLGAFSPMAQEFRESGIEIVAIGTEELPEMKKALEAYKAEKQLHFPLVSDANLKVFKRYRCFDDFENMTLHGTFLIDGEGQIRWSDISYEPFTDAKFLLRESQRLLSLPRTNKGQSVTGAPASVRSLGRADATN